MSHYEPNSESSYGDNAGSVSFDRQAPVEAAVRLDATQTARQMWVSIVEDIGLVGAMPRYIDQLVGEYGRADDRERELMNRGVTGSDGSFAQACSDVHKRYPNLWRETEDGLDTRIERKQRIHNYRTVAHAMMAYGSGSRSVLGYRLALSEIVDGPLAVLRAVGKRGTIAIRIDDRFESELRASQRRSVLTLIGHLATTFDVRVVVTEYRQAQLAQKYAGDLPDVVSESITPTHDAHTGCASETRSIEATIDEAFETIGPDSGGAWLLDELDADGGPVEYSTLYAAAPFTPSGVRERLSVLERIGLVERGSLSDGSGCATIRPVGTEFVDRFVERFGRQSAIDPRSETRESDPQHPSDNKRVCPAWEGREGDGGGSDQQSSSTSFNRVRYLSRWEHEAVRATVVECDIGVADHAVARKGLRPVFSYDSTRDELIVGAKYTGGWGYLVGTALALVSPAMWADDGPVPPERLDTADASLGTLCSGNRTAWTMCSQGGWMGKHETTGERYVARLKGAGRAIERAVAERGALVRDENYDAAAALTGEIMADCQGLIGTVAALLNECGVTFIRYLAIPNYRDNVHSTNGYDRRRSLFTTISLMCSIGSMYGGYTSQRSMREPRPEKREFTLGAPNVEPGTTGRALDSLAIIGEGVSRMVSPERGPSLIEALDNPRGFVENGYNTAKFDVPYRVRSAARRVVTRTAVRGMCNEKLMTPTADAIGILHAVCQSPFTVTRALNRLGRETKQRDRSLRLDEVRTALSSVPSDELLNNGGRRTTGALLKTLLLNEAPLSTSDLADLAEITTQTVRRCADLLEALAIVERHENGPGLPHEWRCTLPTREEYTASPAVDETAWATRIPDRDDPTAGKSFDHVLYDLATALNGGVVPPSLRRFDGVVRNEPRLCREVPALRQWLPVAASLGNVVLRHDAFEWQFPSGIGTGDANVGETPDSADQATLEMGVVA